ncbi:MAG: DNA primase small subunit domain-containing protein [Candidatus Woesearchaeota archaeon]
MLELKDTLSYYKRRDVMKLILEHTTQKEIGVRFGDGFGKRPDTLNYENDILEFAKKGCTSFHCSEESWTNPLHINSNLRRNELDTLRSGWDLILDIDCPFWLFSKLTTYVFIKALKDHAISAVTVKFSGGKGFHIAVPFESFPKRIGAEEVKNLFPEGPRKIAEYLLHYVNTKLITIDDNNIQFAKVSVPLERLEKDTGKKREELVKTRCIQCRSEIKKEAYTRAAHIEYLCAYCGYSLEDVNKPFLQCPKCKKIMEKKVHAKSLCICGSNSVKQEFDLSHIVAVDTVLISSRHLFRMPYSLHEKTGLVSVPFDIKHILKFEKSEAQVSTFKPHVFLNREKVIVGEASLLFQKAFEFTTTRAKQEKEQITKKFRDQKREITSQGMNLEKHAIPEECFPPCIKKISAGLEDGKKRALFILIKFLDNCFWTKEEVEEYILKWNDRNKPDQLKETYIRGQLRYHYTQSVGQKDKSPSPNCDNKGYMVETQFCNPDMLCRGIKNPIQYARKKMYLLNNNAPRKQKKSTEDKEKTDKERNTMPLETPPSTRRRSKTNTKEMGEEMKKIGTIIDQGKAKDEFE